MLKLLPLLVSGLSADLERTYRRKRRNILVYCVAGLFALTAYLTGVMIFVLWLMQTNTPMVSLFALCIVAISLSLITIAGLAILKHYESRKTSAINSSTLSLAAEVASHTASTKSMSPLILTLVAAFYVMTKSNSPEKTKL